MKPAAIARLACALLAGLVFAPPSQAAPPWVPVDCDERAPEMEGRRARSGLAADTWDRFLKGVETAKAGDPLFAPHPFPKSDEQVIEDFRYAYFEILHRDPAKLEAEERPIYDALKAGELSFDVLRVENWSTSRCHPRQPIPFYFAVRLLDADKSEVARGILHFTGLFSRYGRLTDAATAPADLETVGSTIERDLGLKLAVDDPQYVAADGLPMRCLPETPCVAFRHGAAIYLLTRGPLLYEIDPGSRRWPVTEYLSRLQQKGHEHGLGGREVEHPLVSLGMEGTTARRIAGNAGSESPRAP